MRTRARRAALAIGALALAMGAGAPVAQGATSDPLFVFVPTTTALNGPCGLAVDSTGRFFVSDYYHHAIDAFTPPPSPFTSSPTGGLQIANEDPLDGPCGLAFDSTDHLFINNFHRNVVKAPPSGATFDSNTPTGVAVDAANNVYVNDRTYIQEYNAAGIPVQQIGLGSLDDGYGVAVSSYSGTSGYIYVPDASTNTVKVYDPVTSLTTPKAEIKDPFNKAFVSLRDSAITVDRVSGDVYFADNLQPQFTEKPQAEIYIYSSTNSYKGHLKYNIADALPPGLAVDNSPGSTQGRVYVTSGNTTQAGVYAYGPGAGTFATPLPPTVSLAMGTSGSGAGAITANSPTAIDCALSCDTQIRSGAEVDLSATPNPGSTFTGWSGGGCSGTGDCTVRMDEAKSVGAEFEALPSPSPSTPAQTQPASATAPTGRVAPHRRAGHHGRHRHKHHRAKRHRHRAKHRHPRHRSTSPTGGFDCGIAGASCLEAR